MPATRSLVRAKRVLAAMPGGGGTPIASALSECLQQAQQLGRQGLTPLLVVLSDGRANVSLEGIGGRAQAHSDAMGLAQRVRLMGVSSVWVDTAPQPEPLAQALEPGTVVSADASGVRVACGAGQLCLTQLQRPGGKRLNAADFLRGCPLQAGQSLKAA